MKTYAVVNLESGLVENTVVWNGEDDWKAPEGTFAMESEVAGIGWSYTNGEFVEPPPVVEPEKELTGYEIIALNTAEKTRLMDEATKVIAPLQMAVDVDEQTEEEAAKLKSWKKYVVLLNRVDVVTKKPNWPTKPI